MWVVGYAQEQNISTARGKLNKALAQGELPELKETLKAKLDWGSRGLGSAPSRAIVQVGKHILFLFLGFSPLLCKMRSLGKLSLAAVGSVRGR